jgi:hypothetical protein
MSSLSPGHDKLDSYQYSGPQNSFLYINMLKTALLFVSDRPLMLNTIITIYKEEKNGHTEERMVNTPLNVKKIKPSNVVNRKN